MVWRRAICRSRHVSKWDLPGVSGLGWKDGQEREREKESGISSQCAMVIISKVTNEIMISLRRGHWPDGMQSAKKENESNAHWWHTACFPSRMDANCTPINEIKISKIENIACILRGRCYSLHSSLKCIGKGRKSAMLPIIMNWNAYDKKWDVCKSNKR